MTIIYFFLFIIFIIMIFKTIKTELPKRIEKERLIWQEESKPEFKRNYGTKQDINMYESFYKNRTIENKKEMSVTDIANHFKKSAAEINQVFLNLKWIEKSDNWYIATKLGESKGANQKYSTRTKNKYVVWNNQITNNQELIQEINNLKNINTKMTDVEKKEKGDKYESYVASFFREQGYYVLEYGKEKGVEDCGVDLFMKKDKNIYFVQCKDWEKWKLDHNTVQAIQTKIRNFLKKEDGIRKIINNEYKQKILYVTSKRCLTAGAYRYIEENSEILEYQVVPIGA